MDGIKCTERGYHEFRNFNEGPDRGIIPKQLRHIKCADCPIKAADYLVAGWVHPE